MNFRLGIFCFLLCGISNIATPASAVFFNDTNVEKFKMLVKTSPTITDQKNTAAKQCEVTEIEMHFKKFNFFNSPDLVEDWQYHYVVGEPSKPKWKPQAVANIVVYLEKIDDSIALEVLINKASDIGGCGIQDVFREPVLMNRFADGPKAFGYGRVSRTILGYAYYGKIIRRKDS